LRGLTKVYDNFGNNVMADDVFGNEFIARHLAALLGAHMYHITVLFISGTVLKRAKELGIAASTPLYKKVLGLIKKRLECWLATKDAAKYKGIMHKALLGHPWLMPPKNSRIHWEAK
jgi:hypothetical protein